MSKEKIWLSSPHMGEEELNNVKEAFATNWISPAGPFLQQFEAAIKTRCRVTEAAAIQSGTAGIHLALRLLDLQPGEVVLCQSFTFIASCNPILYERAEPVFIDSEKETWNMCPIALEEAIVHYTKQGKKPKAIIVVHLYGMPANMHAIQAVAEKHQLPIIEDAAEVPA